MNLALLLPAGLVALAALLLPLLIHLARRSEQRITDFAALRWLSAKPQPRRKHRFDERLLLLLRVLLIAALALLLARPVLHGQPDHSAWIVAAPGVGVDALRNAGGATNAQRHWLAPGFPGIDEHTPVPAQPIASLVRELDASLPAGAPLTVLVPAAIDGADAERPKLSRRIDWRIVPAASHTTVSTTATQAPVVMVRHAPEGTQALRYLRAAGVAWHASSLTQAGDTQPGATRLVTVATATQPLDAGTRNLVWLVPGPVPTHVLDWIKAGGQALLDVDSDVAGISAATPLWRDDQGNVLVHGMPLGRGRVMQWTRAWSPDAMPQLLESDFPNRLRALFADPESPPARVDASNYRPTVGARTYPETPRPLSPWLIGLIAALFVVERWLANSPRRGTTA